MGKCRQTKGQMNDLEAKLPRYQQEGKFSKRSKARGNCPLKDKNTLPLTS